jgi:hydrogenase maturation protease
VVDAIERGQPSGTLYVFRPSTADLDLQDGERIDLHFAEPTRALKLAKAFGLLPEQVTVGGCEPASGQLGMPLSAPVSVGVRRAVEAIGKLVAAVVQRMAGERHPGTHILPKP